MKPIMTMPKRLACPFCGFMILSVEEILDDGTILWGCLGCGSLFTRLWRCGEFSQEAFDQPFEFHLP